MANDMVETVLAGILEELQAAKKKDEEQKVILQALENKMDGLEKGFTEVQKQTAKQVSAAHLEIAIAKGISRLQQTIEAQPKTVRKELRVLLFPEYNSKEYYRLVFGRLIFWLVVVLSITYLFLLGKQAIEKWSVISSQIKEMNTYRNTWQQPFETIDRKELKPNRDILHKLKHSK